MNTIKNLELANSEKLQEFSHGDGGLSPDATKLLTTAGTAVLTSVLAAKPKSDQAQLLKAACGNPLIKGAKYKNCVKDVLAQQAATAKDAATAANAANAAQYSSSKDVIVPKSNAMWWWIGGVGGFLAIAGLTTFLIIRAKHKKA